MVHACGQSEAGYGICHIFSLKVTDSLLFLTKKYASNISTATSRKLHDGLYHSEFPIDLPVLVDPPERLPLPGLEPSDNIGL